MPKCAENCDKSAYFNVAGGKKGLYCSAHRLEGMINVVDKLCVFTECDKRAIYNFPCQTKGEYCMAHQLDGMVNVKLKRCAAEGCYTTPIYNVAGSVAAKYCVEHKTDEMINVVSKRCQQSGCNLIAQFNMEGEKVGKYCSIHKLTDMVDIKHKRCEHPGCSKSPSYKYLEDTQPRFCSAHKLESMIDGKHVRCDHIGCNKSPIFNEPGNTKPKMCLDHKTETMIDVFHAKCKSEWCLTRANSKYENYCMFCYMNIFPDKPISFNYKTREKTVVDAIIEAFPEMTWHSDKKIIDGCSRKRPDLLLDLGYQVIIIEIDENQHNVYDCSCENKRLMELSKDVGHRPIVFIRFNPDAYIDNKGNKIKTPWKLNKSGISYIPQDKRVIWTERIETLKMQISYWLENATTKTVEIIQLYYDGM